MTIFYRFSGIKQVLLMMAAVAMVGCGKKEMEEAAPKEPELSPEEVITPNEVANKLFVEAVELVEEAQSKEAHDLKGAIAGYEQALAKVLEITREYKESDIAVKLVSGETLFTGKTMAQIKERVGELQRMAKTSPNSLGMVFKPVPGTKVSFCIWETRVKDYAVFAAANAGVDGSWKDFGSGLKQEDTHPVVRVNWKDAQAFCEWLTKKELAEGKIKAGQKYRLPTDAEWSVAMGLDKEKGNTPGEKHRGIKGVYPWGKEWPPPKGAGNYAEDLKADKFDYTSPVGSFASNKDGLHDMGGNVWEWCEDWHDPAAKKYRVLRGASWGGSGRVTLLSSYRYVVTPDARLPLIGFRCVLVGGSGG